MIRALTACTLFVGLIACSSCTAAAEPAPSTPPEPRRPTTRREIPFDPEVTHRRVGEPREQTPDGKSEMASERPGPENTGVVDQTKLKPSGKITARDGQVIENLFITGGIRANDTENVVIRNCVIDGGGTTHQGVLCQRAKNLIIERCEIYNVKSEAVLGDGYTARFNQISQSKGDGLKAGRDVVIEGNYIHSLGMSEGAHADGVQIRGGNNVRIVGNYFDMPINNPASKSNAAVFIQGMTNKQGEKRSSQDILIEGNWFRGGNYVIHAYSDGGDTTSIRVVNNRFFQGESRYGLGKLQAGVVWSGNVFDNTGAAAGPQAK